TPTPGGPSSQPSCPPSPTPTPTPTPTPGGPSTQPSCPYSALAFVGVLLIGHTCVLFLDMLGSVNAVEFAQRNAAAINTWAVVASLLGVLVQSWTGKVADAGGDDEEAEEKKAGGKAWASVAGTWKKVAGALAK
ncbi:MAG: hypothetical protein ABGY75_21995, partial [Gemmataceae bacterium]